MKEVTSFLAGIAKPEEDIAGVFFTYPETHLEVEIFPISTEDHQRMLDLCRQESPMKGFRGKDVSYDMPRLNRMLAEKSIGRIRGATIGSLKKIMFIDPVALEGMRASGKLELKDGEKITDATPVKLEKEDGIYLFLNKPLFKLWVDDQQGRTTVYNAAIEGQALKN